MQMNLKRPLVFLRIPSTTQEILSIRPQNIEYLEDGFFLDERFTTVTHRVGSQVHTMRTNLTSGEIEEGMNALQQQRDEYNDQYFNTIFTGDDE
jgi:hypothetical protein